VRPDRTADWVSIQAARHTVLSNLPLLTSETRPLDRCDGLVLAGELRAPVDLPPWDNSAMDGYAVRGEDIRGASDVAPRTLRVVEDIPAGSLPSRAIGPGEASLVMTGAPVPHGSDSVVRVEHTDHAERVARGGDEVRVYSDADAGRNIRLRGEDLAAGAIALPAGVQLRAGEIGVAASVGHPVLRVTIPPTVALLSSGDELVDIDGFAEVAAGRRIVSSNSHSIAAAIREAGGRVVHLGIAKDDPESIRRHLVEAARCDALVTTAGMSVGDHDHMLAVLAELETRVEFWRVRMRPGSPFAFGRIAAFGGIPWFGLPGNPVSAMVTFELFVRPALLRMAGHRKVFSPVVPTRVRSAFAGGLGLTRFFRVRLEQEPDGAFGAESSGSQGSGVLTSMVEADALLVVPPELEATSPGDLLPAILLGGRPLQALPGY
jgi:molybdopterin molybdotransferase